MRSYPYLSVASIFVLAISHPIQVEISSILGSGRDAERSEKSINQLPCGFPGCSDSYAYDCSERSTGFGFQDRLLLYCTNASSPREACGRVACDCKNRSPLDGKYPGSRNSRNLKPLGIVRRNQASQAVRPE